MAAARLASTSLDRSESAEPADFWAALLGGDGGFLSEEFCAGQAGNGWIAAVQLADYRPPTRPGADVPKQIHLDDLEGAEAEALRLGARTAVDQPAPDRRRALFDRAGHPLCFTTQIPQ